MAGKKARSSTTRKNKYAAQFEITKKNKIRKILKHLRRHPNDNQSKTKV